MTVAELIERLKEIPEEYTVRVYDQDFGWEEANHGSVWVVNEYKHVRIG